MRFYEFKEYAKGPKGQAKGKDKMPKAKPGRTDHPLHGKLVGGESVSESIQLDEGARIQHAEDLIFWEGSAGAVRALESLKKLETGGHKNVTIKWDGSPAVIFGRDEEGNFILTDKSGFTAKGYDGKAKSGEDLENMFLNRSGGKNRENPSYVKFAGNMKGIFDLFERATDENFRGYFKGDLLYFTTPKEQDGRYVFKPNVVQYSVDRNSDIGKRIGASTTGIVVHRFMDEVGNERPLKAGEIDAVVKGPSVLVVPSVTAQRPPEVDDSNLKALRQIISKNAKAIDTLLNEGQLKANQLTDLPTILYTYLNSKVDSGLTNLAQDFAGWLAQSKVSEAKKRKVVEWINKNVAGFNALWQVVEGIMRVKDDIIRQLDQHGSDIEATINGQQGGEGYVLAHPEGDIKLVSREYFTKANRAVERN